MILLPRRGSEGLTFCLGAGGIWIWISAELLESHSFCYYSNRLRIQQALSPAYIGNVWGTTVFFSYGVSMKQLLCRDKEANTKQGLRIMERLRKILFWLEGHFQSFVPWRGVKWRRIWGLEVVYGIFPAFLMRPLFWQMPPGGFWKPFCLFWKPFSYCPCLTNRW